MKLQQLVSEEIDCHLFSSAEKKIHEDGVGKVIHT